MAGFDMGTLLGALSGAYKSPGEDGKPQTQDMGAFLKALSESQQNKSLMGGADQFNPMSKFGAPPISGGGKGGAVQPMAGGSGKGGGVP